MKANRAPRIKRFQRRRTIRLTDYEDDRLIAQADIAGLSMAEYLRRRFFGGRPIVAYADTRAINELRRVAGLLKNNFETLRQADAPKDCFKKQEEALRMLTTAIEKISKANHDR